MKNILFIIIYFCFLNTFSQICTCSIEGVVHDFHNGKPLVGATIYFKERDTYFITDKEGKFYLNNVCSGKQCSLSVSHIGCETVHKTFNITKDIQIDIDLEHHTEELDDVVLVSFWNHKEAISNVETTLDYNDIAESTSHNIADVIENVSGVSTLKTGNGISKPIIHGMHSARIAIINNNSRLQDQDWGSEHDPSLFLNNVNNVTVVKGSSTLEYGGDIIGGAVIIRPPNPIKKDTLLGKLGTYFNTNGRGFGSHIQINKYTDKGWFFNFGANFDKSGDFKAPDYFLSNTGFEKKGGSFIFGQKNFKQGWQVDYSYVSKELGILRAAHVGNTTDLFNAIERGSPIIRNGFSYNIRTPRQEITHHALKTSFFKRFKGKGKLELFYNYQQNDRLEFDTRRGGRSNIPVIDLSLKTHQFKTTFDIDKHHDWNIKLGAEVQCQVNFPNPNTGVRRLIPDYKKYDVSTFAIGTYLFSPELIWDIGIRYDFSRINAQKFYSNSNWRNRFADSFEHFFRQIIRGQTFTEPTFDFHNISFHTGIWKKVSTQFDVRYSLGISQRNPNPAELFSEGLHQSAAAYEIGNLFLEQEKSVKLISELGWHFEQSNLKISPFIQYVNNYIFQAPTGLRETIRGSFLAYEYNQTNAFLSGIDADYTLDIFKNITLNNSISYIYAQDVSKGIPLINIPALNGLHDVNYKLHKNLSLGADYRWGLQQNRVPNNNFPVEINAEDRLLDVSTAPDEFYILGLHSKYEISTPKSKWQFLLHVQNVFNTPYRSYLNRLRYFSDESGTNIQIKINYQF